MDGWGYSFNVVACFTRKGKTTASATNTTRHVAIDSITNAVAAEKPDCSRLRIRTDNGNQYASHDFRKVVQILGISKHEFIWKNTPEQNEHVESFHKTLKKEYM
ncbi:MAG: transposase family protein [Cenarchaeum sp. SB0663_bin_5]|nr:transposase family protein [Cenarchaeum sp. SB0663_bin_5]